MIIGYGRTSTADQDAGLDAQLRDLKAHGCERIYSEKISSVAKDRPQLTLMLASLRKGDVLVVTKLDRFARSMRHLHELVDMIKEAGASLRILSMGIDTGTATGKLMLQVVGAFAEFERDAMLERQRDGIAKAKSEGKYKGRKAVFSVARARALREEGKSLADIADELGVSRQAVHRKLKQAA